jgi:hypothetical protein
MDGGLEGGDEDVKSHGGEAGTMGDHLYPSQTAHYLFFLKFSVIMILDFSIN